MLHAQDLLRELRVLENDYSKVDSLKLAMKPWFVPAASASCTQNTVIGSLPSGKTGWEAQVLSSQASSLTSYVYCAKRKRVLLRHSITPAASDVLVYANIYDASCPVGTFTGGGGFSEEGLTTSRYLIPVESHKLSGWASWHANALIVGSGVPVMLSAHAVCA